MTVNILGKSLRGDTVTSNAHKHTKLNIKIDHEIKSLAARVFHSFIHSFRNTFSNGSRAKSKSKRHTYTCHNNSNNKNEKKATTKIFF